jgi:hypothetical protein
MTRREPEDTWLRHSPPSQEDRINSCGTRGSVRALLSGEAGSKAAGHVATLEPSLLVRQGPESWDVWQSQSPPQWKGRVQSQGTRDSVEAHLNKEAGSGAEGCVASRGSTLCCFS